MLRTQNYFVDYYYYNFPYVLGMLVSLSMIDKLKKGSLTFEEIKTFLKNSGIGNVEEIVANLGIDLSADKFWNEIEVYIEALLDSYCCGL